MGESDRYRVTMEVAGPLAIFVRPDSGAAPISYPVPTWSAAKGMFESIALLSDGAAWICPTKVEVCRRVGGRGGKVIYQRYVTNYGGPLRKSDLSSKGVMSGGSSMQVFATALADVCFRLYGVVRSHDWRAGNDARHHLQSLFERRLRRGECFRTPCLGWSEFTCSYWGSFRTDQYETDVALSAGIPSMLLAAWSDPHHGGYSPLFVQDARIEAGVLTYAVPAAWLARLSGVTGNA